MTGLRFFQTPDGAEISPLPEGADPFAQSVSSLCYLSLFGGSHWWADVDERDAAKRLTSETEALLRGLPRSTSHLRRVEDAVRRDLGPPLKAIEGTVLAVRITLPQRNRVHIEIDAEARSRVLRLELEESWQR